MGCRALELLVLHVLRLEHACSTRRDPRMIQFHQVRSVTWLRLIHSHWLLVASSDDITSAITLWSVPDLLRTSNTTPLAEAFLSAPVINGAVDVNDTILTFALELRGRYVYLLLSILALLIHRRTDQVEIFSVTSDSGCPRICRLHTVQNVGHLRFLKHSYIGLSLVENINIAAVVNWQTNVVQHLQSSQDAKVR